MTDATPPLPRPGDRAPDFDLPAAGRDGTVALADYRGRSPVLLALFRGLYCPFCRHQMAQLSPAAQRLRNGPASTSDPILHASRSAPIPI